MLNIVIVDSSTQPSGRVVMFLGLVGVIVDSVKVGLLRVVVLCVGLTEVVNTLFHLSSKRVGK